MRAVADGGGIPRDSVGDSRDLRAQVGAIQLELDAGDAHVIGRGGRDRDRAHHGPGRWRGQRDRRRGGVWERRGREDKVRSEGGTGWGGGGLYAVGGEV